MSILCDRMGEAALVNRFIGSTHLGREVIRLLKMVLQTLMGIGDLVEQAGLTMAYAGCRISGGRARAGRLSGAAIAAGTERVSSLPDIPTCQEEGLDVVWQVWLGALVHKETPQDRVEKLRQAFAELVEDEGLLRLMDRINTEIKYLGGEEWAEELGEEQKRLLEIYERTN